MLRFYCVWDDRDAMFGEMRPFVLHYFLVDDTIEIREVHEPNDGRDPFPVLLRRQRLPVDRYNVECRYRYLAPCVFVGFMALITAVVFVRQVSGIITVSVCA